jgi:hypothetical protein
MNATLLLAIATLALVVGPLLERVARRLPGLAALIDGATVGGILVVSVLHLLPEAGAHVGWWALLWFALGLVLPAVAERLMVRTAPGWRVTIGFLVLGLFLLHVVLESAALVDQAENERLGLATLLVVVGHRLPVGILLWGHTRRVLGAAWSFVAIGGVLALAWFVPLMVPVEMEFSGALSALLAGGLLHLVLQHRPAFESDSDRPVARNVWSAIGLLGAAGLLVPYLSGGDGGGHSHDQLDLPARLLELTLEVSFPLLVGVVGAALIEAFLPGSATRWLSAGSRLRQAVSGVAMGAPMPVCSCGVLPIYRSLIKKGVPPAAALSLLIAAPEIGVDSFLLSWPLLGGPTTLARLGCALVLALLTGWVVGRIAEGTKTCALDHGHDDERPTGLTPASAIRRGLLETWGHLSPWILAGLVATVLVEPWISTDWAERMPPAVQVLVLSLAGMPTYICATAATPFAALLLVKGFAPGAVIAFLLTGPATNLTTFGALRRLHSRKLAASFVLVALVVTCGLGLLVNGLSLPTPTEAVALGAEHEHGWLQIASAALLGLLTLWVLFQGGPRNFLAQLWPEGSEGREGHGHEGHAH